MGTGGTEETREQGNRGIGVTGVTREQGNKGAREYVDVWSI